MTTRLRIAVFAYEFPALSETFVLTQITGLMRCGHDVEIFATAARPDGLEHADVGRFRLLERTHYLGMPRNRLRRAAAACAIAARQCRRNPLRLLQALNPVRHGRRALSTELLFWLERLERTDNRFDVIHCHFGPIGQTVAYLRDMGAVAGRLITSFHGVDVSLALAARPDAYAHLFSRGDLFLPVSRRWKARLEASGCDPARTVVHHMGVELGRFRYRLRGPRPDGALRLLSVGRLVEKKGIEFGLRAVAAARDRNVDVRYTVVGDGPLRQHLELLARRLGIGDGVRFTGWCDQAQILANMYANDVLLAPSVTDSQGDQEGIPVTLMEAMASGMAVVATRHSGIPELVEDGCSGLLVAESDVDGLADRIAELAADPALRAALGRRGRATVAAMFNADALNVRLIETFERLCGGRGDRPDRPDRTGRSRGPDSVTATNRLDDVRPVSGAPTA